MILRKYSYRKGEKKHYIIRTYPLEISDILANCYSPILFFVLYDALHQTFLHTEEIR